MYICCGKIATALELECLKNYDSYDRWTHPRGRMTGNRSDIGPNPHASRDRGCDGARAVDASANVPVIPAGTGERSPTGESREFCLARAA